MRAGELGVELWATDGILNGKPENTLLTMYCRPATKLLYKAQDLGLVGWREQAGGRFRIWYANAETLATRTAHAPDVASSAFVRRSWRDHPKLWVNGCIDCHGAIRATATVEIEMHNLETSKGKRWRFNIAAQDMMSLAPRTEEEANNRIKLLTLNDEEYFAVCDWLIRNGYADGSILPNAQASHAPVK